MKTINEKLKAFQLDSPSLWKEKAEWRKKNKEWLKKSQYVAIKVMNYLRDNDLSQKYLAERMQVSPQQISKILKGTENLTLETISNLESVLDIQLFPTDIHTVRVKMDYHPIYFKISDMRGTGKSFREHKKYNAKFTISPQQLTCTQIPS
ncbi:MAG: helix-turn-helix domain-containing protein [Alistipes sp.]|nr:helix-turn-helix domain-containing protein [Alistipes sp.]